MQTSRRSFLTALASLPLLGRVKPSAPVAQGLKFHPDAFAFVMADAPITRFDVLYGYGAWNVKVSDYRGSPRPQLSFAEWDAKYQQARA